MSPRRAGERLQRSGRDLHVVELHVIEQPILSREEGSLIVRYRVQVDAVATTARTTTAPFHIVAVPADRALVRFVEVPD